VSPLLKKSFARRAQPPQDRPIDQGGTGTDQSFIGLDPRHSDFDRLDRQAFGKNLTRSRRSARWRSVRTQILHLAEVPARDSRSNRQNLCVEDLARRAPQHCIASDARYYTKLRHLHNCLQLRPRQRCTMWRMLQKTEMLTRFHSVLIDNLTPAIQTARRSARLMQQVLRGN